MIESFKPKGLGEFFEAGDSSNIVPEHKNRLRLILTLLHAASEINDMNFPGANLHRMKGKLKDYWAVKVSGNWQIIFRFGKGNARVLDYIDYH